MGNLESRAIVRHDTYEIDVLHREITRLVRDLLAMELSGESDLRYILASERIANALRVVHSQTVEIAADSMLILENGGGLSCAELANANSQKVVPIPDGMEAFLETIDTCFANASFWSGL